ncbi:MAG: hypothetical protein D4R93_01435 [Deltaproteobacteria bacterium]|nr:MAG: hypothetical protein D4R93_01435 [Deltaproteobacteria bacterium]
MNAESPQERSRGQAAHAGLFAIALIAIATGPKPESSEQVHSDWELKYCGARALAGEIVRGS